MEDEIKISIVEAIIKIKVIEKVNLVNYVVQLLKEIKFR